MTQPPEPLVPAEVDLRGLDYMPFFGHHLLGSEFHARCSDAEWRAGVTLWWAAWNQVPAASLPDDDVALCRLADLGRDVKEWKRLRANALHGFVLCSDGRLYHRFLAGQALIAWDKRLADREAREGETDRKRRERERRQHLFEQLASVGVTAPWNAPTATLRELVTRHVTAPVTPKATPVTPPVTRTGGGQVGTCHAEVTPPVPPNVTAKTGIDGNRSKTQSAHSQEVRPGPGSPPLRALSGDSTSTATAVRQGELAKLLRSLGVNAAPANPHLIAWIEELAITDAEARSAVEQARFSKPDGPIPIAYLDPIVREQRARPKANGRARWRESEEATNAMAAELGLRAGNGESWPAFRERIAKRLEQLGVGAAA